MNITDAEWKIMEELWQQSPLSILDLTKRLEKDTGWKRHTIISFLNRLEAKHAVELLPDAPVKSYKPIVTRDKAVKTETLNFLNKVHKGSLLDYVSYFSPEKNLSKEERQELAKLIKKLEDGEQ